MEHPTRALHFFSVSTVSYYFCDVSLVAQDIRAFEMNNAQKHFVKLRPGVFDVFCGLVFYES